MKKEKREFEDTKVLSRRKFLGGAAVVGAAGATAAATGGLGMLSGIASADPSCGDLGTLRHPAGTWGYPAGGVSLANVASRAYVSYWNYHCTRAVLDGVLGELQDNIGSPYTNVDSSQFHWGLGGISMWGTACGTIIGAALICGLVLPDDGLSFGGAQIGSLDTAGDACGYYANNALPNYVPDEATIVAAEAAADLGGYDPRGYSETSVTPDTPICHIAVGKWMDLNGLGFATGERMDRCARLAANLAMFSATVLNAVHGVAGYAYTPGVEMTSPERGTEALGLAPWFDGTLITGQHNCTDCHGGSVPNPNNPPTWAW